MIEWANPHSAVTRAAALHEGESSLYKPAQEKAELQVPRPAPANVMASKISGWEGKGGRSHPGPASAYCCHVGLTG